MLNLWGYELVTTIRQLHNLMAACDENLAMDPARVIKLQDADKDPIALAFLMLKSLCERLELHSTEAHVSRTIASYSVFPLPIANFKADVDQIQMRLEDDLRLKQFISLKQGYSAYWQRDDAFNLGTKFANAHADIRAAGNCLAVEQGTACILHLDRAMEVALKQLAKRLKVEIRPKDTWGSVLGKMTPKIDKMAENTQRNKTKKQRWSEARTHMFHLKECWRDRPMHGHESYSSERAKEIYEAVRVFMTHLAAL